MKKIGIFFLALFFPLSVWGSTDFFLRDGDIYVIYGDSITDNTAYPRLIENYVLTRFPKWNVTFFNLGYSGDMAYNLFRLKRDILPVKPTAITECMGMNDAGQRALSIPHYENYIIYTRHMVRLLREANPKMRIALVSAIPYENRPGADNLAEGTYAQVLRLFSRAKQQLARELDLPFVDLFTGYGEKVGLGKVVYPDFILSSDGIHPNDIGQTMIGMIILQGLNATSEIAALNLEIIKNNPCLVSSERCRIKDLKIREGVISFQRMAEALPCPVEVSSEQARRFLDLVNFADEINRDMLTVRNLPEKAYELKINGIAIDIYSSRELASGINIALPAKGPIWDQALGVAQATLRRQQAHYAKWRTISLKNCTLIAGRPDLSDTAALTEHEKNIQAAIQSQHTFNQPRWYSFTLTPAAEKPLALPHPIPFKK